MTSTRPAAGRPQPCSFGAPAGLGAVETEDALRFLAHHRVLHEANGTFHWAEDAYIREDTPWLGTSRCTGTTIRRPTWA